MPTVWGLRTEGIPPHDGADSKASVSPSAQPKGPGSSGLQSQRSGVLPGPPDERLPCTEQTRQEATARPRSSPRSAPARKLKLHPRDYISQRRQSFSDADKARCAFYQPTSHRKTAADGARRPITRKEAGAPPAGPGSVVESWRNPKSRFFGAPRPTQ